MRDLLITARSQTPATGPRGRGIALAIVLSIVTIGAVSQVHAHAFAPSLLELRELDSGRVAVRWKQPAKRQTGTNLVPVLPSGCTPVGEPR